MDSMDTPNANLPARLSATSLRLPAQVTMGTRELAMPSSSAAPAVNIKILLRGLMRNWWIILLLWLGISAPLAYLIYTNIQPTYTATGMVKVESSQPDLFGPTTDLYGRNTQPTYLLTEIETIRSNPVLELALAREDPDITKYPALKQSKDPKNDLRSRLQLVVVPNTHWIRVSVDSTSPDEARDYVNAVLKAYEETAVNESLGTSAATPTNQKLSTKRQIARKIADGFRTYKEGLERRIKEAKATLLDFAKKGNIEFEKPTMHPSRTTTSSHHSQLSMNIRWSSSGPRRTA